MARKRDALLQAVELVEGQLAELRERQQAAFDSLTMSYKGVSERTRAALAQHADTAVAACDAMEEQVRTLRLGVGVLDEQARTIDGILADPNLTPERWREPAVYQSLKRLFAVLVAGAELRAADSGATWWPRRSIGCRRVVKTVRPRARGSRTHRRGSSPRPLVLKTRTATGPHPLSLRIVERPRAAVKSRSARHSGGMAAPCTIDHGDCKVVRRPFQQHKLNHEEHEAHEDFWYPYFCFFVFLVFFVVKKT